jgi:hypothetical protein
MGSETLTLPSRPSLPHARVLKGVLLAVFGACVLIPVSISLHAGQYDSFLDNPLSAFGMWGTFAIHMWTRPGRREWSCTVALALLGRLVYDVAIGERGYSGSLVISMGGFLGLATLAVLAIQSVRAPLARRAVCRRTLGVVALFSYLGVCLGFYVSFAKMVLPRKLDYFLYNFDASLGFQSSFALGALVRRVQPLGWMAAMVYNCFGFWFSLIYAVHAASRRRYPVNVVKLVLVNALAGFSLYFLYPAAGPKFAFPAFPLLPGPVHSAPAVLSAIPNAMPSLHFGGALLIFWLSKPWKWLYWTTGIFAALTAFATLGLGEHYLVDLIVAVPYAVAVLAFAAETPGRRNRALLICGALVLGWFGFLRTGIGQPALSWAAVIATIGTALALERKLAAEIWGREERA